jgi:hypothetical protein
MGFFKRNKYTMEVYLTDIGRETFVRNGFKNAITHFSLVDNGNYEQLVDFNPTVITGQTIPTISYYDTVEVNGVSDIYTQNSERGSVDSDITFKNGFLGVNQTAQKNYIIYEPDLSPETLKITTYKD